jgi:hypothetical protein
MTRGNQRENDRKKNLEKAAKAVCWIFSLLFFFGQRQPTDRHRKTKTP